MGSGHFVVIGNNLLCINQMKNIGGAQSNEQHVGLAKLLYGKFIRLIDALNGARALGFGKLAVVAPTVPKSAVFNQFTFLKVLISNQQTVEALRYRHGVVHNAIGVGGNAKFSICQSLSDVFRKTGTYEKEAVGMSRLGG
jgi:hypothetical protein